MTNLRDHIPEDLKYSTEHEWLRLDGESARIGITAFAQDELGEIVYVDLPKPGARLTFMQKLGEVESVKVTSVLYSPATGEVTEVNSALDAAPELVNQQPYGEGWLLSMRLEDPAELEKLLDHAAYRQYIEREQHLV